MNDMKNLADNNGVLNDKTLSSVEMTNVIDTQVKNVAGLMEQVVQLIGASVDHANISAEELVEVVEITNKMATLSKEVEQVLEDFKAEFKNVKEETSTIGRNHFKDEFTCIECFHRGSKSRRSRQGICGSCQ